MKNFLIILVIVLLSPFSVHAASSPRVTPVVRAVTAAAPAVVNITSSHRRGNSPLEQFFGPGFSGEMPGRQRSSLGTGVIVDGKRGLALTNAHVTGPGDEIRVHLQDGREFQAELIGMDGDFDIAVLQIKDAPKLPSLPLGTSNDLMPGEPVIAIGNPFGFGHTVTTGVISATNRSIRNGRGMLTDLIQTDAAINPGNSGGPLLNIEGALIGINTAIDARAEGIGFAIPIDKARRVMEGLVTHGRMEPLWLGLIVQDVDQRTARALGLSRPGGVLVSSIAAGAPASKKLRQGDVIVKLNSAAIRDKRDYVNALRNQTGTAIEVAFIRDGKPGQISLVPAPFTDTQAAKLMEQRWGFTVQNRKGRAVVASADKNGPAQFLQKGDQIRSIGQIPIKDSASLYEAFRHERMANQVILMLERGGRNYYGRLVP